MENTNQQTQEKKIKKRPTVIPLILTPVIFVAIAAVLVMPMAFKAFGTAKDTVHQMQNVLHEEIGDIAASDAYFEECRKEGIPQSKDALQVADKVGTLSCNNAAVNCDVFYGINRVSRRCGAGLSAKSGFFGEGGAVHIDGDASASFKALRHVKKGDVFTVQTADGEYVYTVQDVQVCREYAKKVKGEYLLLTTAASDAAFAAQNPEKLTVVATLGEEAEE